MKINVEIDCTPSEARRSMGLPDFEPVQQAVMERLEKTMLEQVGKLSVEGLLQSWFSAGTLSAERMRDLMASGLGGRGNTKTD